MSFLKNAWYTAGWANDVTDAPLARTILGEPVVIFRTEDGQLNALQDACPHRFAPLSKGKLSGDRIACPYHGLEFSGAGQCLRNPHGKGTIPAALSVRSYPLVQRYGMVWIWMGDAATADPVTLPDIPRLEEEGFTWIRGQLHVNTHYELVVDNLLDLTHVEFLHPILASPGNSLRTQFQCEQDGDVVRAFYDVEGEPITGLFQILWSAPAEQADLHAYMHWHCPSNLYLDTGMISPDDADGGPKIPTVHFLTPETEDSTHYFWAAGRNRHHDNEQVAGMLYFGTQNAFENEDEPMIRAVRSRMKSNDLFAHKPALLPMDEAAVRARRVLSAKIAAEHAG
ncbi:MULTISPECIES: aromatic ring-hydroxylating dioxygenase subunit alpha [unclassified Sphingobium]|uniref:aromatic ring-hydroxylating dioxygenase subunit alpha n=1 Tax=unclassified Sphingobium TaxID=2611147 RepID=UPI002224BEE5|nr:MULTISPECIES: aromatic ring-hydroxylating dioxygenase subunit alpha [unclassified Sphingobium]MCW2394023.1 vanillate O-demethylase monooxygenase subunit [Sphingobium sp. B8D3B]MCW2417537.1 vanillate O-demethylase monooxygenase subunit [Sphingobium sp. B8D3C]